MKLIICGSRNFNDYKYLRDKCIGAVSEMQYHLEVATWEIELVSGHADGTDKLGEAFARQEGIKSAKLFPLTSEHWNDMSPPCFPKTRPDGTQYNALAGSKRNQQMLDYVLDSGDYACTIGFVLGDSRGTKDMIRISKKAELPTWVVYVEKDRVSKFNQEMLKIGVN